MARLCRSKAEPTTPAVHEPGPPAPSPNERVYVGQRTDALLRIGHPFLHSRIALILLADHMRALIVICAVLIGLHCADLIFYSGALTIAATQVLQRIGHGFQ